MTKLWGGRFSENLEKEVEKFTFSLHVDHRLFASDIEASIAHAKMLGHTKIISYEEAQKIISGLEALGKEIKAADLNGFEDIHSAIESLLTEKLGAIAGKLHTARSRNDQVITATRVYVKKEILEIRDLVRHLQEKICQMAEAHIETILPGLTHMQHGQTVSLAHHLMAYFWMLQRDYERFEQIQKNIDVLPLGSGALAGTSLPIDRNFVARELGFSKISNNSLDAVSDRDFIADFLHAAALCGVHFSRLAEELILWSTPEFGFVEMSDSVTTGSSLMPQKKNPDVAELLRGRTGRYFANWNGLMTTLKALPLSYNRDLQEDKEYLFSSIDLVKSSLSVLFLILSKTQFKIEKMAAACEGDFSDATDLADYLVKKGVPFRETHHIAGKAVKICSEKKIKLSELDLDSYKSLNVLFEADLYQSLGAKNGMRNRNSLGGTGTEAVKAQIIEAKLIIRPC